MTLHEAMVAVLREHGDWLDRDELACRIAQRGLYARKDGSTADGDQMRLRALAPEYSLRIRERLDPYSGGFHRCRRAVMLRVWLLLRCDTLDLALSG